MTLPLEAVAGSRTSGTWPPCGLVIWVVGGLVTRPDVSCVARRLDPIAQDSDH